MAFAFKNEVIDHEKSLNSCAIRAPTTRHK
jgi:hypothetical protein